MRDFTSSVYSRSLQAGVRLVGSRLEPDKHNPKAAFSDTTSGNGSNAFNPASPIQSETGRPPKFWGPSGTRPNALLQLEASDPSLGLQGIHVVQRLLELAVRCSHGSNCSRGE